MKKFTVFTPTYNRAHLLPKLYEFLQKQTLQDFEWIIVDDGSTDNTKELVKDWPAKYFYQENAGKHSAYNKGILEADSELFVCIDSDDYYVPNALLDIYNFWQQVEHKEKYAGLGYLSAYENGEVIGTKFPKDVTTSNHFDIYHKFDVKGDKALVFRTEVLKEFYFPVIASEKFVTESVLFHRIAKKYQTIYLNQIVEIKEYHKNGLTDNYFKILAENPKASALYYNETNFFEPLLRNNALYVKYCLFSGINFSEIIKNSHNKLMTILAIPRGIYRYFRARKRLKKK